MITQIDVRRKGSSVLLGIAVENAVLDVLTDQQLLQDCLKLLQEPHRGLVSTNMGSFGIYSVTLTLGHDDAVAIIVDGPDFNPNRTQSAGIWLEKEEFRRVLLDAVQRESSSE